MPRSQVVSTQQRGEHQQANNHKEVELFLIRVSDDKAMEDDDNQCRADDHFQQFPKSSKVGTQYRKHFPSSFRNKPAPHSSE